MHYKFHADEFHRLAAPNWPSNWEPHRPITWAISEAGIERIAASEWCDSPPATLSMLGDSLAPPANSLSAAPRWR